MTRHNSSEKPSRRSFAKSVAGSLIAAPFVSTLASASQPQSSDAELATADAVGSMTASPAVFKEHIPPFIISDGSLEIEAHGLGSWQENPSTGPKGGKYTSDISKSLGRVKLIAIYESKELDVNVVESDPIPIGQNKTIRIFLEKEKGASPREYASISAQPQIEIKSEGTGSNTRLILESDVPLEDKKPTHKTTDTQQLQREKYRYPSDGGNVPFRIGRVMVGDTDLVRAIAF